MKQGTQIVCIPDHADGNILHEDCEFGFVWKQHPSTDEPAHFCRYWRKNKLGELRTVANSDEDRYATDAEILSHVHSLPPQEVVDLINKIFADLEASMKSKTAQEVS